jgi:next-to-BRCA1 protein 1
LNIPLGVGSSSEGPRVIDINVQPIEDTVFHQSKNPNAPPEPVNQMVDEEQRQELGNEFPTMETTFVPPAASAPASSVEPSSVSYPIIDFSGTASAVPSNQQTSTSSVSYPIIDLSGSAPDVPSYQQTSTVDALPSSLGMNESKSAVGTRTNENEFVEEVLLKELEEMGFKHVDLNKKVLRWNEYDLEQSVEELCGVSEWDPLLHELHEMVNCFLDCFFSFV